MRTAVVGELRAAWARGRQGPGEGRGNQAAVLGTTAELIILPVALMMFGFIGFAVLPEFNLYICFYSDVKLPAQDAYKSFCIAIYLSEL